MTHDLADFQKYFAVGSMITIGIDLADHKLYQGTAAIQAIRGDRVELELPGDLPETNINAKIVLTNLEGWALCRCEGVLAEKAEGKEVRLRLIGPLEVQQRREYFRLDVAVPVLYNVSSEQQLNAVHDEWQMARSAGRARKAPVLAPFHEGFKVVHWHHGRTIKPIRANLSGSGIRFNVSHSLVPGTLVNLEIFLPLVPARVITAVGTVVRSKIQPHVGHGPIYLTAFHFEFIDERDREAIISYLFMEQRTVLQQKADKRIAVSDQEPAESIPE